MQAAEVGLLTRNIVVQGKPGNDPLIGGQVIVNMTQVPQSIFGVEFVRMGQQGNLGRYPVHFHLCGRWVHPAFRPDKRNLVGQSCLTVSEQLYLGFKTLYLLPIVAWYLGCVLYYEAGKGCIAGLLL